MIFRTLQCGWYRLFFARISVLHYALLRLGLGTLITGYLIGLLPVWSFHFSPAGWLGQTADPGLNTSGPWSVLFLTSTPTQSWLFVTGAIATSLCFTAGIFTRCSGILTLVALISIWNRNPLVLDGDDAMLRIMLLFLLFSPCGTALSLLPGNSDPARLTPVWPLRMIQIQTGLVYFVSGWVKFHSPEWLDGTILQYVLTHPAYSRVDFSGWMNNTLFNTLLALISHTVMWWELLFPVLILGRYSRRPTLCFGLLFHTGLLLLMKLRGFSLIMLTLYLAFIPGEWLKRFNRRRPPV